jgi:MFS family permease
VLRHRQFALLTAGQVTSAAGDVLLQIAVLLYVWDLTRSPTATTLTFLAEVAPRAALSIFAGAVADRFDRRRLLMALDALRGLVILALLWVDEPSELWLLLLVVATHSALGSFFRPAQMALVPSTVPAAELASANALTLTTESVVALAAPPVGAVLLTAFGLSAVAIVDAITFAISIATLAAMKTSRQTGATAAAATESAPEGGSTSPVGGGHFLREVGVGFRYCLDHPTVRVVLMSSLILGVATGMVMPVLVPFLRADLHVSPLGVGLITSAYGAAALAGGFLSSGMSARFGTRRLCQAGSAGGAVGLLVFATAPHGLLAAGGLMTTGASNIAYSVGTHTLMQQESDESMVGRVFGTVFAGAHIAALIAAVLSVAATSLVGARGTLMLSALFAAVAASVTWAGLRAEPLPATIGR